MDNINSKVEQIEPKTGEVYDPTWCYYHKGEHSACFKRVYKTDFSDPRVSTWEDIPVKSNRKYGLKIEEHKPHIEQKIKPIISLVLSYPMYKYESFSGVNIGEIIHTELLEYSFSLPASAINTSEHYNKLGGWRPVFEDKINSLCKTIQDKEIKNKEINNHPFILSKKSNVNERTVDGMIISKLQWEICILLKPETETIDELFKRCKDQEK